jgi:hypothetical protein
MGLFQRLFGATRDAITLPNFDGSKAVNISATVLRECIDRGSAGPDGPNRARLAKPFARGYLFGFSDTCIQRFGVFDELESLALITVVHGTLLARKSARCSCMMHFVTSATPSSLADGPQAPRITFAGWMIALTVPGR